MVESGDAREVHHMALLVGYGAGAVNPYLAFESVEDVIAQGMYGLGEADPHVVAVRVEPGRLADHRGVHVHHSPAMLVQEPVDLPQQVDAVGSGVALVGVREVLSDVAQAGGPQQRVDDRVRQNVPVGVTQEAAAGVLDHHSPEDQGAPLHQTMRVVSDPRALAQPSGSMRRSRRSNVASSLTPIEPRSSIASS